MLLAKQGYTPADLLMTANNMGLSVWCRGKCLSLEGGGGKCNDVPMTRSEIIDILFLVISETTQLDLTMCATEVKLRG